MILSGIGTTRTSNIPSRVASENRATPLRTEIIAEAETRKGTRRTLVGIQESVLLRIRVEGGTKGPRLSFQEWDSLAPRWANVPTMDRGLGVNLKITRFRLDHPQAHGAGVTFRPVLKQNRNQRITRFRWDRPRAHGAGVTFRPALKQSRNLKTDRRRV